MHDVHSFVGELVRFDDPLVTDHLDNEAALGFVCAILHAHLAPVYCAVPAQRIVQAPFEDGKESFGVHAAREATIWAAMTGDALIVGKELLAVKRQCGIGGF